MVSLCRKGLVMLSPADENGHAEELTRAQAPGQDNAKLAQFLEQAFSAAEASGAAAILPYEFIPHEYEYNSSLYEFGTNSAAYTSGVAGMYQFQAQRVRHLAVPGTCD